MGREIFAARNGGCVLRDCARYGQIWLYCPLVAVDNGDDNQRDADGKERHNNVTGRVLAPFVGFEQKL